MDDTTRSTTPQGPVPRDQDATRATAHARGVEAAARALVACDPFSPPLEELPASRQRIMRLRAEAAIWAYLGASGPARRPAGAELFARTTEALELVQAKP